MLWHGFAFDWHISLTMAPHQFPWSKGAVDSSASIKLGYCNRISLIMEKYIRLCIFTSLYWISLKYLVWGNLLGYDLTELYNIICHLAPNHRLITFPPRAGRGLHEIVVLKPCISYSGSYANYTTSQFVTASYAVKDTNDLLIRWQQDVYLKF